MSKLKVGTMGDLKPVQASISAVITRANGTVEDLGVVAYYHRNPLRRWAWQAKQFFTKSLQGVSHGR